MDRCIAERSVEDSTFTW